MLKENEVLLIISAYSYFNRLFSLYTRITTNEVHLHTRGLIGGFQSEPLKTGHVLICLQPRFDSKAGQ